MIEFDALMLQFAGQGEKTGWTYIEIPANLAQQLKPGNKKSFRVRGMLDGLAVRGMALMPMGEGNFIMALKADVRKKLRKNAGAMLHAELAEDTDFTIEIPRDLQECFDFDPDAYDQFMTLPKSHRDYFIKWIDSAKTPATREKRIVNTVNAMLRKWDYPTLIRQMRNG